MTREFTGAGLSSGYPGAKLARTAPGPTPRTFMSMSTARECTIEPGYFFSPGRRARSVARLGLAAALTALIGCTQTGVHEASGRPAISVPARVLLMPPDIELAELTAGGLEQPRADWTEAARGFVNQALGQLLAERAASLVRYQAPDNDPGAVHAHQQLQKLHNAVGLSILLHQYNPQLALPSKQDRFDWTLGPGARRLAEGVNADYALFVYLHDSYASGGRVATMVALAVLGIAVQGGVQVGFASLVDTRSGDIVWFNRLVSTAGDLRSAEAARAATKQLLTDLPL